MAKKKKDKGLEGLDGEEKKGNKAVSIIITALIVLIWLGIIVILIKLDVGDFGSKALRPILKDVPVLNMILPAENAGTNVQDKDYPYKSLAEAIKHIKELEVEIADEQAKNKELSNQNEDYQTEIERLRVFEKNQQEFETLKSKFYDEVVFGEDAIEYENYITYYQAINPEKGEELYKEAVDRYAYDTAFQDQADAYSKMDPDSAATIFIEMSGDMDIVVNLLQCMKVNNRAQIISAIADKDANYAAKLTKLIVP